jgi:hypothetical protein
MTSQLADMSRTRMGSMITAVLAAGGVLLLTLSGCGTSTPPLTPSTTLPTPTLSPPQATPAIRPGQPTPATTKTVPVSQLDTGDLPNGGGQVQVMAISCWAAGDCVAGGGYSPPTHSYTNAFLASEESGHWSAAFLVPGLDGLNVGGDDTVTWVSCQGKGACSAGGTYCDDANAILTSLHQNTFVDDQIGGTWYRAIPAPGLRSLNQGDSATLDVGACVAMGSCWIAGTFFDSKSVIQLYTDEEDSGVWQPAKQLGSLSMFDPRGDASFSSLRCSSISDCSATISFADGSSVAATLQGGAWQLPAGA